MVNRKLMKYTTTDTSNTIISISAAWRCWLLPPPRPPPKISE